MTPRAYSTDEAFRVALEDRVKAAARAQGHLDATRQRQLLLADRFLLRVSEELGPSVVAKGGIALELRLPEARATQDLDLHVSGTSDGLLERLQRAGRADTGDRLRFEISTEASDLRTIVGDGVLYEGFRYRVRAALGGRPYGDRFGLDVVFGGKVPGLVDETDGLDLLSFAGARRGRYRLYPRELHLAEKLHAYTMPRPRPNGRVKDLPDMALLAMTGTFAAAGIREALSTTFLARSTHPEPKALPGPPEAWDKSFTRIARNNRLPWKTLEDVTLAARLFLDPVLSGADGDWNPAQWTWNEFDGRQGT